MYCILIYSHSPPVCSNQRISIPYLSNLDAECTEDYLRNCIYAKDALRDILRIAKRSIRPLNREEDKTRLAKIIATKSILSNNTAISWAVNTRRALRRASRWVPITSFISQPQNLTFIFYSQNPYHITPKVHSRGMAIKQKGLPSIK